MVFVRDKGDRRHRLITKAEVMSCNNAEVVPALSRTNTDSNQGRRPREEALSTEGVTRKIALSTRKLNIYQPFYKDTSLYTIILCL